MNFDQLIAYVDGNYKRCFSINTYSTSHSIMDFVLCRISWSNKFFLFSITFFHYTNTEVHLEHWKSSNSAFLNSRVSNIRSEWLKVPPRSGEKLFCLWNDVPQTLTRKIIWFFSQQFFFQKSLDNFLFIWNGEFELLF